MGDLFHSQARQAHTQRAARGFSPFLFEKVAALIRAELDLTGGARPRVIPFIHAQTGAELRPRKQQFGMIIAPIRLECHEDVSRYESHPGGWGIRARQP